MAKMSVYVPDDLLAETKRTDPEIRLSGVLQDALRSRLLDRSARPYAALSDALLAEREEAQRLVIDRVAEAWRAGYAVGLVFAKRLPWEAFENFDALYWNLPAWRRTFDEEAYENVSPTEEESEVGYMELEFEAVWEEAADDRRRLILDEDTGAPVGVAGEGFTDAIRDVWEGARSSRASRAAVGDPIGGASEEAGDDEPA